jgi:hypothetical protein
MKNFAAARLGKGKVVHAMFTTHDTLRGAMVGGCTGNDTVVLDDASATITCKRCLSALPSWDTTTDHAAKTPASDTITHEIVPNALEWGQAFSVDNGAIWYDYEDSLIKGDEVQVRTREGDVFMLRRDERVLTQKTADEVDVDAARAEALKLHLCREAQQHRVLIVTGGTLHDWTAAPEADFVLNLSRLLRDPAHVPSGEMLDQRGDLDENVQKFVLGTPGAGDLLTDWALAVTRTSRRTQLVVHVQCRGGKHRAAAFGKFLLNAVRAAGIDAAVHHLHAHLDRVITGEKAQA